MTARHSYVMIMIIAVFIRVTVWWRELLPNKRYLNLNKNIPEHVLFIFYNVCYKGSSRTLKFF